MHPGVARSGRPVANPLFVSYRRKPGAGQSGVQSTDSFLVVKTKRSRLDGFFFERPKFTARLPIRRAAGPVGRQAEAGPDGTLRAEILILLSRSRGLFAGGLLEGSLTRRSVRQRRLLSAAGGTPTRSSRSRRAAPRGRDEAQYQLSVPAVMAVTR